MRPFRVLCAGLVTALLLLLLPTAAGAQSPGTAFTYQGQLASGGALVNDTCDFTFTLHDALAGGAQVGPSLARPDVAVIDGLFTISLDFGDVFTGAKRWLAIAAQCSGDAAPVPLAPRQELTPNPYAIWASSASSASSALSALSALSASSAPWAGITGKPAWLGGANCAPGQISRWNGAEWVCSADADTTYTAGTWLDLEGTIFNVEQATLNNEFVNVTGDTMTGGLTVPSLTSGGMVDVGTATEESCEAATAGALRWSPAAATLQYCNGADWVSLAPSPTQLVIYNAGQSNGNLGGSRAAVDATCAASANRPLGLSQYRALITVNADDEIRDMPTLYSVPTGVPVRSVTGATIDTSWNSMLDTSANLTSSLAAAGVLPAGATWWSGSIASGAADPRVCSGWATGAGDIWGAYGNADAVNTTWIQGGVSTCSYVRYLLCIAYTP